jgi:hypothetical protein
LYKTNVTLLGIGQDNRKIYLKIGWKPKVIIKPDIGFNFKTTFGCPALWSEHLFTKFKKFTAEVAFEEKCVTERPSAKNELGLKAMIYLII